MRALRTTAAAFVLAFAAPALADDASIRSFTPNGAVSAVTAPSGSSSAATPLPTGPTVLFQNTDVNDAWLVVGGPTVAATTNQIHLRSKSSFAMTPGGGRTHFAVYGVGGTANVVAIGGVGGPMGW